MAYLSATTYEKKMLLEITSSSEYAMIAFLKFIVIALKLIILNNNICANVILVIPG